ncbi:MAG: insulinase family protein [Endomicrobia bacterium]|nr:insulinase family protein [Endomicrobiia bacterium]MCL2506141.1 insulinase family protein [Endomicrobiia bacterium]
MKKIIGLFILFQFVLVQNAGGAMNDFTLKNGIKVIFNKTGGANVVSVRVVTPVSVIVEGENNAGISSLTARLMAKATKNRSVETLAKDVDNIGADLYSDTDYDMSGFNMSFLPEYFDKACEIFADVIINPLFDENELNFEKKDTIAGLNSRRDSIGRTASDNFIKLFYGTAPYSLPVPGSEKTVSAMTSDNLNDWHKYSYNASNVLISIAGNIDEKIVKKSLEKYFGNIETGKKFETPVWKLDFKRPEKVDFAGKFNQAYILQGFSAPSLSDKDFVTLKVINAILGGRMTSVLFMELREKLGLAYEVNAVYPSRIMESYFAVYIGLDKKNISLTLNRIDEILKDFRSKEVDAQELKDTKTYIKGLYIMDRQTVGKRSYYHAWREIVGQGYKYDEKYLDDVENVTAQDIKRVANRIFGEQSLTVIINPETKK